MNQLKYRINPLKNLLGFRNINSNFPIFNINSINLPFSIIILLVLTVQNLNDTLGSINEQVNKKQSRSTQCDEKNWEKS